MVSMDVSPWRSSQNEYNEYDCGPFRKIPDTMWASYIIYIVVSTSVVDLMSVL